MSSRRALDGKRVILATDAERHRDYLCLECSYAVRVRGGPHRQTHFFHIHTPHSCGQHKKSLTHIAIQDALEKTLPEALLEHPFPEIGRIADVSWVKEKIIFEIQCSSIPLLEVQQRNADYGKLGFRVVWILHDKKFNRRRLSAAENFLRQEGAYFTNINAEGEGIIYDQRETIHCARRIYRGPPLLIHIAKLPRPENRIHVPQEIPPPLIQRLKMRYTIFFHALLEAFSK